MNGRRSPVSSLVALVLIILLTGIATASWDGPVEKVEKEETIHQISSNKVSQDDKMNEQRTRTDLENAAKGHRNEVDQNRVDPHKEARSSAVRFGVPTAILVTVAVILILDL